MSDPQNKPNQRCCLGLMYFSQVMEEQGKRPVCLGLPHTPTDPVHLPDQKQLAEPMDYKFMCLGHSLYEQQTAAGQQSSNAADSHHTTSGRLPYCEGLEVIMGTTLEAAAAQAAAAAAAATGGGGGGGSPGGGRAPQTDDLAAVLTSMFGGEDSPLVKATSRFNKIAHRNWERMKTTASQAYTVTIKQLIDKLSDQ